MNPILQTIVGASPQTNFTVPTTFPTAGKSARVVVNGTTVAFTRTSTTVIALRVAARAGSIVNFFDDVVPSITGLVWSGSLDFPSIATAASANLTATITGAELGDLVSIGLPANNSAGVVYQGYVSAANVVTIRATNITLAAIDPATGVFRIRVSKV